MKYISQKKIASLLAVVILLLPLGAFGQKAAPSKPRPDSVEQRIKTLHTYLDQQWQYTLSTNPEFATILGDKRYNDRLNDRSLAAVTRDLQQARIFLRKFESVDTAGFPEQERLNRDLMLRDLREQLEGEKFRNWEMPITQFGGIHIDLPQEVSAFPFTTVKDYEDYISRLKQVPKAFDDTILRMKQGMRDGLVPPKILLLQVVSQAKGIADQKPEDTPFAQPILSFPKGFTDADQKRLRSAVMSAITIDVLPAYRKLVDFVRDEYSPKGRSNIGLWALPNGPQRYAFAVRSLTTTNMTPDEIYKLGVKEVARIEGEEAAIAKRLGFDDLEAFKTSLKNTPDIHPKSRQQILDEYQAYTDQMWKRLPELFGRLPKAKLEILPVEAFREKEASTSYNQGTPDGSRPGRVYVNTYDFANQLTINNEDTAYHEGVPGHHMQISIAQELEGLPEYRQQEGYTGFVEGWALYCESLGKELGFYQNPYSDFGRLDDEMLRAIRLVIDSGIHSKKWTREQAVDYFHKHSMANESYLQSEVDRYIAWPGQATAYKVGQLTILGLREKAKRELGAKFDIRAFHDEVLGAGALPLDVLTKRIDAWIARTKSGKSD